MFTWQDILAGLLGGSIWQVNWRIYSMGFESKEKHAVEQKEIEKNEMYYGESVDCNIIM